MAVAVFTPNRAQISQFECGQSGQARPIWPLGRGVLLRHGPLRLKEHPAFSDQRGPQAAVGTPRLPWGPPGCRGDPQAVVGTPRLRWGPPGCGGDPQAVGGDPQAAVGTPRLWGGPPGCGGDPLGHLGDGHLAVAVGRRNCGLATVGSCTYVITSICTVVARAVAAHLSQVAKLAWPGQTGHTQTGRFEHAPQRKRTSAGHLNLHSFQDADWSQLWVACSLPVYPLVPVVHSGRAAIQNIKWRRSVWGQDVCRWSGGGQLTSLVSLDSDRSNKRHGCDSPARLTLVEDSAVEQSALQKSATSGGLQELSRQRLLRPALHTRDGLASIGCREKWTAGWETLGSIKAPPPENKEVELLPAPPERGAGPPLPRRS
ncbi:unnamed protein product [Boreogadus saida]